MYGFKYLKDICETIPEINPKFLFTIELLTMIYKS